MLSHRFNDAFNAASSFHLNQIRKGSGIPYITHPMAVFSIVMENGGDEDCGIAALLHDCPEDCGGKKVLDYIYERYGEKVGRIVEDCTDSLEQDKNKKLSWKPRKEKYLSHLPTVGDDSKLVSLADKFHNITVTVNDVEDKGNQFLHNFRGKADGILWYYKSLRDIFVETYPIPLTDRFSELVDKFERIM